MAIIVEGTCLVLIKKVIPYRMDIILSEPFSISFGTYTHAHGSFVVIKTTDGIEGYGEGCPDKMVTGGYLGGIPSISKEDL